MTTLTSSKLDDSEKILKNTDNALDKLNEEMSLAAVEISNLETKQLS